RHGLHDLLKEYARRLNTSAEADRARQRLLDWYNQSARSAAHTISPGATLLTAPDPRGDPMSFKDGAEAMAWYKTEELNLSAATASAAEADDPVAWLLPDALRLYYARIADFEAWRQSAQWGL